MTQIACDAGQMREGSEFPYGSGSIDVSEVVQSRAVRRSAERSSKAARERQTAVGGLSTSTLLRDKGSSLMFLC